MSARIICYHLRNVTTTTATAFRRTYAIVHHDFPIVSIHPPKPPNPANLCRPLPTNATEVPIRTHRPNVQRSHVTTPSSRARWMMPITTGGLLLVGTLTYLLTTQRPHKTEAPPPSPSSATISSNVGEPGLVPSGTTSVPPFPRILRHPTKGEYVLVGLGIRTVSFLRVQVYVVGFYVHADDEAAVRAAVVRRGGGEAVAEQERSQLRRRLLDPIAGEQVFDEMLGEGIGGWRSLFRVVPTRNTDFQHLRDGWIRGIQARSAKAEMYDDDEFAEALAGFKSLFGGARRKVPKKKTLLVCRDAQGELEIWFDEHGDGTKAQKMGETVKDPRVSRALWLCYLAGKNVASEPARENIVDGVLEMVSRPISR